MTCLKLPIEELNMYKPVESAVVSVINVQTNRLLLQFCTLRKVAAQREAIPQLQKSFIQQTVRGVAWFVRAMR